MKKERRGWRGEWECIPQEEESKTKKEARKQFKAKKKKESYFCKKVKVCRINLKLSKK